MTLIQTFMYNISSDYPIKIKYEIRPFGLILIKFFIISVLLQHPKGLLQIQHNNKYKKVTTYRLYD
jgi:plastocyanin domain-containing protein